MRSEPGIGMLRTFFDLDTETGQLVWKIPACRNFRRVGKRAGGVRPDGYRKISVNGFQILEHRAVFAMHNGYWPSNEVDHVNGDRADNRPCNLREATKSENGANKRTVGPWAMKGISRSRSRWRATLRKDGKFYHIGVFDTPEAAHAAYVEAAKAHHGGYARAS